MRGYDEPGVRGKEAKHYNRNNYGRNGKHHAPFPRSNPKLAASFESGAFQMTQKETGGKS